MTMEFAHNPRCNRNHARRQQCRESTTPGDRPSTESTARAIFSIEPRDPPTTKTLIVAGAVEAAPGLLFGFAWLTTVRTQDFTPMLLIFPAMASGLGWLLTGRPGPAFAMFIPRLFLPFAWFFGMWEAYTNDSSCYRELERVGCYQSAETAFNIFLAAATLMPVISALMLIEQRILWRPTTGGMSPGILVLKGTGFAIVVLSASLLVSIGLGVAFDRSNVGRASIVVSNQTGLRILIDVKGAKRSDWVEVGETKRIFPHVARFETPSRLHIVAHYADGLVECAWHDAKRNEPLVVGLESAGCTDLRAIERAANE